MIGKTPDQTQREEKVTRLKEKILKEIDSLLYRFKIAASETEATMIDFEFDVERSFALFKLREYINNPVSFNQTWNKGYIIRDLHIDMWLQEDYTFAFNFLWNAEEHNFNVIPLLNDAFFELYFTNIGDEILYEKKLQKSYEY